MDTADSIADHPVTSGGVVAKRASVGMATQQPPVSFVGDG